MPSTKDNHFYLGKASLPTPEATFNYKDNPEWIIDLEKCKKNILYFAENFFYIVNLDEGRQKIKLRPYQKRILRALRDNRYVVLLASRQSGKALGLDTPIPSPSGWKTMKELKDNDIIYDDLGKPCNVIKAHDILYNQECYEIEFDSGEKITAHSDHLWFTQNRNERRHNQKGSIKTTRQIFDTLFTGNTRKDLAIPTREPNHRIPLSMTGIQGNLQNLPIDPYVLGLWLGDGCSRSGAITAGERDIYEIIDILKTQQTQFDKLTLHKYGEQVYTLRISVSDKIKTQSLNTLLKLHNLYCNKHIPEIYLRSNREQRLALLQGLMDSDGYIDTTGNGSFTNTNLILADQVKGLIESLGYKASVIEYIPKLYGIECAPCKTVMFRPIELVCKLSFKRSRIKCKEFINNSKLRCQWHYIKNIKPIESIPVRCITVDSPNNLYMCGKSYIPTHNTVLMTIYALWIVCFYNDQRVLIVANKEATAINIFKRVRLAYEQLPNYLKPGTIEYGKTSLALGNGSSIGISTTSSDAGRGESVSCVIIDEMAHIEDNMMQEFWESVYPIISASKKSKLFVCSTPKGTGNQFHTLYDGAMKRINGWHPERVDWWEVPDRDEEWKKQTIKTIGSEEAFNQEFQNEFLQSGESAVSEELFKKLKQDNMEPKYIFDDGKYVMWDTYKQDHLYTIGVDVSEGVGENASVIQVLDITDLSDIYQVALYANNSINPIQFIPKCFEIFKHWGSPPVLIERNNCGAQVVDQLKGSLGYSNIVNYGPGVAGASYNRNGVMAHTNTKYKGVVNMRYYVNELVSVRLRDPHTLAELKTFIRHSNGTWSGKANCLDDRVMSLIWALMILDIDIVERYFEVVTADANRRPLKLALLDYGTTRQFIDPLTAFTNLKGGPDGDYLPTILNDRWAEEDDDHEKLKRDGWKPLNTLYV